MCVDELIVGMLSWLVGVQMIAIAQSCNHAGTTANDDLHSWAYQWGALQPHGYLCFCYGKVAG